MRQRFKIHIEISNICNLQCSFCPEVIRPKSMMTPDAFSHALDEVAPYARTIALHLMGDPLVHPQLGEILERCSRRGVSVFFVTNGLLLRDLQAALLLHPVLRQVSFSLHSFPDNFGDRDPSTYLDRIFAFTERAFEKRPTLFTNYRLWNLSEPLGEDPRNRLMLDKIQKRFGPFSLEGRETKAVPLQGKLSLHFDTRFEWPSLDIPQVGTEGTCHGVSGQLGVLVDGTVVPCCLDKEGAVNLGNVFQTPLKEILKSPRTLRMAEGFRKGVLVEELCKRCSYIERFGLR